MTASQQRKPVIGITTSWSYQRERTITSVPLNFCQSVVKAGGLPLLLPLCEELTEAHEYAAAIDGLLLTGGYEDIDPDYYGEPPIAGLEWILPQRDRWEMLLLKDVLALGKPALGICRGMQLINVASGGSLYQNLRLQYPGAQGHFPKETAMDQLWHRVQLEPGSKLHEIFAQDSIRVNSFHNQAVKQPAPDFIVSARAEDGMIEAIESQNHDFLVGVQWHPEALTKKHPQFIDLFRALVEAC